MKKKLKKLLPYLFLFLFTTINMAIIGWVFTSAVEKSVASGFAFICAVFFVVLGIIGFSIVFWLMSIGKELIATRIWIEQLTITLIKHDKNNER